MHADEHRDRLGKVLDTHLHLVAVHAHKTRNFDLLAGARVVDKLTFAHRTLVDPHVRKLAKATLLELEREGNEGRVSRRCKLDRGRTSGKRSVVGRDLGLGGRGQVRADTVEHGLHSRVLDRRTKEYRGELEADCRAANGGDELGCSRVLVHDQELTDLVVDLGQLLDELATLLLSKLKDLGRNFVRLDDLVALLALVVDSLPTHEVDNTAEIVFDTNRHLHRGGSDPELLPDLVDDAPWVCTWTELL